MDSFTSYIFSAPKAEDEQIVSVPVNEDDGGSGGNSYCVIA